MEHEIITMIMTEHKRGREHNVSATSVNISYRARTTNTETVKDDKRIKYFCLTVVTEDPKIRTKHIEYNVAFMATTLRRNPQTWHVHLSCLASQLGIFPSLTSSLILAK